MSNLNLIILAGGSSSRFAPLKEKNLYKFLGKEVPKIQVEKFIRFLKPHKTVIIGNETNTEIISEIVKDIEGDIEVRQQIGDGMAGAANTGLENFADEDDLLILNMNDYFEDTLFEQFAEMLSELREKKQSLLTGFMTEKYFPGGYLVLDDNNYVKAVYEKPGEGNEPSKYVRIVFDYFASVGQLKEYMSQAQSESDDVYEVALTNMMQSDIEFVMLDYRGKWVTIKYPWHVLDVMNFFLDQIDGQVIADDVKISDTAVIRGNVIIESGTKIFDNAVVSGPAYIGKNCIIGNNALVRGSMLGNDCIVGYSTEVTRSYWLDNVWTHKNYIGDSIIENDVSFGSHSLTANLRLDEQDISVNIKGERLNSGLNKLGNIIGSNVRVGVGAMLMPGVKIASNSFIGSGVLLDRDVEENKFVRLKQDYEVKDNNFDISQTNRDEFRNKLK